MLMQFSKSEGLGNDFIVVGNEPEYSDFTGLAKRICHRHFGVGADGLILFRTLMPPARAHFGMRIFNADGSEAELSGNGLRCLGAHLIHLGLHEATELCVETRAGLKKLRLTDCKPPEYSFEVDMGPPILERSRIPLSLAPGTVSLTGYELAVDGRVYAVTITSMGNPHCSLFVNELGTNDWEEIGRQIEVHRIFPNRTNVEFIKVKSREEIEVRFWERGVGKTNASGTGSCAAVVAAILNGYTDRHVKVETLGGCLQISWKEDDSLCLKGPARFICKGEYDAG
jgi:diaminopimelate epimerase